MRLVCECVPFVWARLENVVVVLAGGVVFPRRRGWYRGYGLVFEAIG